MTTAIPQIDKYLETFTEFQKRASGRDLPWLKSLRENAFSRFCERGFPTTHDEDWRFTNVAPIARMAWAAQAAVVSAPLPAAAEQHLGRYASVDNAFVALNTAFLQDGGFVYIPTNCVIAAAANLG